ncbi:MAG: PilZ domain-containing protein [Microthrixaceae bacterium]|nr:PilZ domain-containing protein [Microthrixaceae bacterium]
MDFDARIGQRFDVHGVSARWEPHADTEWVARLRTARGETTGANTGHSAHHAVGCHNATIENVSVSGAGIVAPADQRSVRNTSVTVTLGPGSTFDATIRRVLPCDDLGWAYFGVEFTTMTDVFRNWLDHVIESHRGVHSVRPTQHAKDETQGWAPEGHLVCGSENLPLRHTAP